MKVTLTSIAACNRGTDNQAHKNYEKIHAQKTQKDKTRLNHIAHRRYIQRLQTVCTSQMLIHIVLLLLSFIFLIFVMSNQIQTTE